MRQKRPREECPILAKFSLYSYVISYNLCLAGLVILLQTLGSWVRVVQEIRVQEKHLPTTNKQMMIWG